MEGLDKVAAIQALYQDLLDLSENHIPVIERLQAELDAHIEAFKQLLDHKPKDEGSRAKLKQGKNAVNGANLAKLPQINSLSTELSTAPTMSSETRPPSLRIRWHSMRWKQRDCSLLPRKGFKS